MKLLYCLLPVLLLTVIACKKDNTKPLPAAFSSLEGKWQLHATYASIGGGGTDWKDVIEQIFVTFKSNGAYNHNLTDTRNRFILISDYMQTGESLLKLYKQGSSDTDTASYFMKLTQDTLILNYIGCIEGCGEKYVRVQ